MFTISINTGNAAFKENLDEEIARILTELAERSIRHGYMIPSDTGKLRDVNGNTVGSWTLELDGE